MYDDLNLLEMAEQISEKVNQANNYLNQAGQLVIEAGKMVCAARKRVEDGEVGEIGWYAWAKKHTGLGESRLRELFSIGSADDPLAEAQRLRGLVRDRAKKRRDKKKATPIRIGGDPRLETAIVQAPETAGGETGHDPQSVPEEVPSIQSLSGDDRERRELIAMFTEWALTASILDLRHEMSRIIARMRIPANTDRRQRRDAA